MKWLYSKIWARWLWNDYHQCYDKVIKVKGWRTARIETKSGARSLKSPCFSFMGFVFD